MGSAIFSLLTWNLFGAREQAEAAAVLGSVSDEALAQALVKLETAVTRIQVAARAR